MKTLLIALVLSMTIAGCGWQSAAPPTQRPPTQTPQPIPTPYVATLACPGCDKVSLWLEPFCDEPGVFVTYIGHAGDEVRVIGADTNACGNWVWIFSPRGISGWVKSGFVRR